MSLPESATLKERLGLCVWPASADPEQTVCRLAALQGCGQARLLEGPAAATPGPANHQEQQDGGQHPPLHLTPRPSPPNGQGGPQARQTPQSHVLQESEALEISGAVLEGRAPAAKADVREHKARSRSSPSGGTGAQRATQTEESHAPQVTAWLAFLMT